MSPRALLDANVLVPISLSDLVLRVAERGLYRPLWSNAILAELARHAPAVLARRRPQDASRLVSGVLRRIEQMRVMFPDASVDETPDHLVPRLPDEGDRHVLVAALAGQADTIVTFNLRDFPAQVLPEGTSATHPDDFLFDLTRLDRGAVLDCVRQQSAQTGAYGKPFLPIGYMLRGLELAGVPKFVADVRAELTG